MIRGTTPTIEFELPFDPAELEELYITINQNGKTVIEKTLSDCNFNEKLAAVKLSQEDTLELCCHGMAEIQVRGKDKMGTVFASNIEKVCAERVLKDGVI